MSLLRWIKERQGRIRTLANQSIKWLVFSVAVALFPFAGKYVQFYVKDKPVDFSSLLSDGSLLTVSAIVAASGLSELLVNRGQLRAMELLVIGTTLLVVYLGATSFATVTEGSPNKAHIRDLSANLFLASVISGLVCIISAEVNRWQSTSS
jgi:hypothetical protein